jgi:hypothetical protein
MFAQDIPDGAIHKQEKIFRKQAPEVAFNYAVFWFQVATMHQAPELNRQRSGVIIKSWELVGLDAGGKEILSLNFAGDTTLDADLGGLYDRNPTWFDPINKDRHTPIVMQQVLPGQGLMINASATPDKIVHWWMDRFPYRPDCRYQIKMIVQIVGDVAVQIGGDYWRGENSPHNGWDRECRGKNNCEAFVSQWYGDTKGEFITITREL